MDIKNLEKFIKLCRKHGVSELKTGDFELKLTDPPERKSKSADDSAPMQQQQYTDMDMLFWSTGGVPLDNGEMNA